MEFRRWDRFAAAGGAVFAVLLITGLVLAEMGMPGSDAGREEVLVHFGSDRTELRQEIGATLAGFAVFFLLPFLSSLRSTLRAHEGGRAILSTAAFAGGLVMAALLLVSSALVTAVSSTAGFFDAYRLDADTPLLFSALSFWLQGYALVAGGVLAASASLVALKTRVLPRWLAIIGIVLGVVGFFGESAMALFVPFPLLMLWILVVSVVLVVRGPGALERGSETALTA